MDVPRPQRRRTGLRRALLFAGVAAALAATTLALSRLEAALPHVPKSSLYLGEVERGEMLRLARGAGSLTPRQPRWVTAEVPGRIERVLLQAGELVEAETVLFELSNLDLEAARRDAEWDLQAAQALYESAEQRLENEQLDRQAAVAKAEADLRVAQLELQRDEQAFALGIKAAFDLELSRARKTELERVVELERNRAAVKRRSSRTELRRQGVELEQARSALALQEQRSSALLVRAGAAGVVDQLQLEVGQAVAGNDVLARIIDPRRLRASVQVPEAQIRRVRIGQDVEVDTRHGILPGRVERIDPTPQAGTVGVDVELLGELNDAARPDLSVTATIELERLPEVLKLPRPVGSKEDATISLFRLSADGSTAEAVSVRLGAVSVRTVEVVEGLGLGDKVVLSNMAQWADESRIALD